jgi:hypothetical protein
MKHRPTQGIAEFPGALDNGWRFLQSLDRSPRGTRLIEKASLVKGAIQLNQSGLTLASRRRSR